jgi:predicted metal-dependent hydrolase
MEGQLRMAGGFPVEVIRSARRKKTVGAQVRGGVLQVIVPSWLPKSEEARWVDTMSRRFSRHASSGQVDLGARARSLALRFALPLPDEIRWVTNMEHRWGSCTPATRTIRISDRIAAFPNWVIDYVVVHELAHLCHADHSPAFRSLEGRYPKAERAIGYLIAKSGGDATDEPEFDADGLDDPHDPAFG